VVFAQMFNLPTTPHIEIFYGSLLIELCKLQPSSMPQVLAQATEMLFERLDTMNAACIERFTNWFSYHLSNFQFRWSWEDWSPHVEESDLELPKAKFVKEVLQKCLRLSYVERLADTVPAAFAQVLPQKPKPMFKYEEEGIGSDPGTMAAHQLITAIKSKCNPQDVFDILRTLPNPLKEDEGGDDPNFNPLKVEVFTQTLLYLGAKSFSHTFAAIAKFHVVLKALAETEEGQMCLLRSMRNLWRYHQQMMVVIVDKLLKTQIVECASVANWLFSPEMTSDISSFYVWEIMHSTIKKMNKHVSKLQKELDEARDKFDAAESHGRDMDDEDDDIPTADQIENMEEKLEGAQSEQKNLFLIIFQRFIIILTDHLARCESEGKDYNTPWYKWIIERLQQMFLQHHEQVYKYTHTLENLIFTSDIDFHILEVFQQFCSLRS